eukprot:328479-Pleurochrysis_carterae.AAC.3
MSVDGTRTMPLPGATRARGTTRRCRRLFRPEMMMPIVANVSNSAAPASGGKYSTGTGKRSGGGDGGGEKRRGLMIGGGGL